MASFKTVFLYVLWMIFFLSTTSSVMAAQRESSKPKENIPAGSSSGTNKNNIDIEEPRNGPYIDKAASKNVTALLGKTAYLNCRVKNLGNKTDDPVRLSEITGMLLQVSWIRHRDIHLLTVGRYTYTSDQRFRAIHHPHSEDWILQIKYPQHRDSGIYECQVSTTPHISHYIHLNVIEPSTEIIGAPDLYIESGSTINLTCVVLNSPEPPAYIFWNHNNAIISYDSPRGGVSVITEKGETTTSFLLIKNARPSDSGQYQCNPSNAKSKSVMVHVLNEFYRQFSNPLQYPFDWSVIDSNGTTLVFDVNRGQWITFIYSPFGSVRKGTFVSRVDVDVQVNPHTSGRHTVIYYSASQWPSGYGEMCCSFFGEL